MNQKPESNEANGKMETLQADPSKKAPDEKSGIAVQGHLKIFDPESGEIILTGRA